MTTDSVADLAWLGNRLLQPPAYFDIEADLIFARSTYFSGVGPMPQAKKKTVKASKTTAGTKATAKTKASAKSKATAKNKASTKSKATTKAKATAKKTGAKKSTGSTAKKTAKATAKTAKRTEPAGEGTLVAGFKPYTPKKGEEYMSPEQEDHFRGLLRAWKRDLMEEVDRTVHHMQDEAANFPDPNDRATQESEFSLELRARDRERKLIKKIDEALNRIDIGEYGFCDSCGVEIGIRRLEARPTATLCIDCKTLDEIREKQMG
jgi:DnaK suppressor protein